MTLDTQLSYIHKMLFACSFRDSNTLFRGNSVATKSVDEFMKHAGMFYLHDTIKCLVDEVRATWKHMLPSDWIFILNFKNIGRCIQENTKHCLSSSADF